MMTTLVMIMMMMMIVLHVQPRRPCARKTASLGLTLRSTRWRNSPFPFQTAFHFAADDAVFVAAHLHPGVRRTLSGRGGFDRRHLRRASVVRQSGLPADLARCIAGHCDAARGPRLRGRVGKVCLSPHCGDRNRQVGLGIIGWSGSYYYFFKGVY